MLRNTTSQTWKKAATVPIQMSDTQLCHLCVNIGNANAVQIEIFKFTEMNNLDSALSFFPNIYLAAL